MLSEVKEVENKIEMFKTRTAGDGMESDAIVTEPTVKKGPSTSTSTVQRLVQVFPTNTITTKKKSNVYSKSPKFVPYEPYKAAVKPIIPYPQTKLSKKPSKNNMDINVLISQMSQMNTDLNEFKPKTRNNSEKSAEKDEKVFAEREEMQKRIDELTRENESVKEQLKQQAQVNKELKTMLVASMGEDLETQVNTLNEDKKHLANALNSSTQHLSTHQEQTEWLAGQCEVWRSKFLASSLMVEELANWKKILSERTSELQQAIKQIMDERCRARDLMLCTYKNLAVLHENWLKDMIIADEGLYSQPIGNIHLNATPHSSNILDLATINLKLSENISSLLNKPDVSKISELPPLTEAEKYAENLMALPLELKKVNEEPVNALVSHAYNSSGNTPKPIASCVHCNGKVQLL